MGKTQHRPIRVQLCELEAEDQGASVVSVAAPGLALFLSLCPVLGLLDQVLHLRSFCPLLPSLHFLGEVYCIPNCNPYNIAI